MPRLSAFSHLRFPPLGLFLVWIHSMPMAMAQAPESLEKLRKDVVAIGVLATDPADQEGLSQLPGSLKPLVTSSAPLCDPEESEAKNKKTKALEISSMIRIQLPVNPSTQQGGLSLFSGTENPLAMSFDPNRMFREYKALGVASDNFDTLSAAEKVKEILGKKSELHTIFEKSVIHANTSGGEFDYIGKNAVNIIAVSIPGYENLSEKPKAVLLAFHDAALAGSAEERMQLFKKATQGFTFDEIIEAGGLLGRGLSPGGSTSPRLKGGGNNQAIPISEAYRHWMNGNQIEVCRDEVPPVAEFLVGAGIPKSDVFMHSFRTQESHHVVVVVKAPGGGAASINWNDVTKSTDTGAQPFDQSLAMQNVGISEQYFDWQGKIIQINGTPLESFLKSNSLEKTSLPSYNPTQLAPSQTEVRIKNGIIKGGVVIGETIGSERERVIAFVANTRLRGKHGDFEAAVTPYKSHRTTTNSTYDESLDNTGFYAVTRYSNLRTVTQSSDGKTLFELGGQAEAGGQLSNVEAQSRFGIEQKAKWGMDYSLGLGPQMRFQKTSGKTKGTAEVYTDLRLGESNISSGAQDRVFLNSTYFTGTITQDLSKKNQLSLHVESQIQKMNQTVLISPTLTLDQKAIFKATYGSESLRGREKIELSSDLLVCPGLDVGVKGGVILQKGQALQPYVGFCASYKINH